MDRYEYTIMKLTDFNKHVQQQYILQAHAKNGYFYLEIRRSIHGLSQAGKLVNTYLRDKLRPHGYYEVSHTRASGNIYPTQLISLPSWITLVWSMVAKTMPATSSTA